MTKSTPFTLQDLEGKGFKPNAIGEYVYMGKPAVSEPVKILTKIPKDRPIGLVAIENILNVSGLKFVREYEFSDTRKFKFDIAIPGMMLGIEYEGIFSNKNGQNGHTGVKHYIKDCDKYNLAAIEGWRVLRYTAKNYKQFLDDLKQLI